MRRLFDLLTLSGDVIGYPQMQGTASVDFGSAPGTNIVTVAITGQTGILTTSQAEAWIMQVASTDHNAYEHGIAPMRLTCGSLVAGTGFTITALCEWRVNGLWTVQWIWL